MFGLSQKQSINKAIQNLVIKALLLSFVLVYSLLTLYEVNKSILNEKEKTYAVASVIASNVRASLLFNDTVSAEETISTLVHNSSILFALLTDSEGRIVASYGSEDKVRSGWNDIEYIKKIHLDGDFIGELSVVASLDAMWNRVQLGLILVGLLLLFTLFIATVFVKYLSLRIVNPIKNLVTTSRDISDTGDYNLRTPKTSDDEIGELTDTFNNMLNLIEKNDDELRIAATTFDAQDAIIITDNNYEVIKVNAAFSTLTGYKPEEVEGSIPIFLDPKESNSLNYEKMMASLRSDGQWTGELLNRHKQGHNYPVEYTISTVHNSEKIITHYVISFVDITKRVEAEEEIRNLAFYDPLTQLANRRLFLDRLGTVLKTSLRSKQFCALIFLDLDKFKLLNDSKGHGYGDMLLMQVSIRLLDLMRENDTVARLGGDEFVVLLENLGTNTLEATSYANTVGSKIVSELSIPYILEGYEYKSSSSVGITLARGKDSSVESALLQADMAMYSAKNAGRNTLRFFDVALQHAVEDKVEKEKELHLALDESQFELYYQVLVNADEKAVGAEALVRWNHPSKGLVGPDDFIPLAEEIGLIHDLGAWVLHNACQQLKLWEDVNCMNEIVLAVNISAMEFQKENFVENILNVVRDITINPAKLKIELTESVMLDNINFAIEKITQLKDAGISVSMDDFGTGYSSLNYLSQLPVSIVKIDRSFIARMVGSEHDISIVKMVISLGEMLGMEIVSEGIETKEQAELLRQLGCDYYQGYYFSRPVTIGEYEKLIQSNCFS